MISICDCIGRDDIIWIWISTFTELDVQNLAHRGRLAILFATTDAVLRASQSSCAFMI
jgi:hypothetical protein